MKKTEVSQAKKDSNSAAMRLFLKVMNSPNWNILVQCAPFKKAEQVIKRGF